MAAKFAAFFILTKIWLGSKKDVVFMEERAT
jgi:hypothetical protein